MQVSSAVLAQMRREGGSTGKPDGLQAFEFGLSVDVSQLFVFSGKPETITHFVAQTQQIEALEKPIESR